MKKIMFLLAAVLFGFAAASAQQNNEDLKIKPLLGVWQYVEEAAMPDGQTAYIGKQIYKTITSDKKYYVIAGVNVPVKPHESQEAQTSTLTFVTQEGDIVLGSDNSYLEYINNHYLDKNLNNTISQLRYRFNEDNPNVLYLEYNLGGADENWVSEVWLRVVPFGAK
ncbi:MAG: DUF4488 domain-containing protein [Bacteroidaceae bacterium]|nr:DUF4488 domain-containing protein [Bacteroidaceae bacterium]